MTIIYFTQFPPMIYLIPHDNNFKMVFFFLENWKFVPYEMAFVWAVKLKIMWDYVLNGETVICAVKFTVWIGVDLKKKGNIHNYARKFIISNITITWYKVSSKCTRKL